MKIWIFVFALISSMAIGFSQDLVTSTEKEWTNGRWFYRGEILGSSGWSALYHGKHREFSGLNAAAGAGVRPFSGAFAGLGFEGRFAYLRSNVETSSDVLILSGSILYHFSRSKVQPYVFAGLGLLRGERTVIVQIGSGPDFLEEERYQDNWDKIGLEFGGGLKVALTPNLALRPEFRLLDTTPGEGYNLGVPQMNLGVSYHW